MFLNWERVRSVNKRDGGIRNENVFASLLNVYGKNMSIERKGESVLLNLKMLFKWMNN